MYDQLSVDYDRFVNWPARLSFEMPFIERQLAQLEGSGHDKRVLDAACGTGMHVIALAERGYLADGADLSEKMIERARENARRAGVASRFQAIGFGGLAQAFPVSGSYDALLCMGNSLPHLTNTNDLADALADFAACLRPGGMLFVQNRNFDAVMARQERWMEPQAHQEDGGEWLFVRFYDFAADGLIDFNILTLSRSSGGNWQQQLTQTRLYPLRKDELAEALNQAGFTNLEFYGSMDGQVFDPITSGNLIVRCSRV